MFWIGLILIFFWYEVSDKTGKIIDLLKEIKNIKKED